DVTAKDFRTWAGTVLAALALSELGSSQSETEAQRKIRMAVAHGAGRLGNTPAICRKCYVHPQILDGYLTAGLTIELPQRDEASAVEVDGDLAAEEAAVLAYLAQPLDVSGARKTSPSAAAA